MWVILFEGVQISLFFRWLADISRYIFMFIIFCGPKSYKKSLGILLLHYCKRNLPISVSIKNSFEFAIQKPSEIERITEVYNRLCNNFIKKHKNIFFLNIQISDWFYSGFEFIVFQVYLQGYMKPENLFSICIWNQIIIKFIFLNTNLHIFRDLVIVVGDYLVMSDWKTHHQSHFS